MIEEMKSLSMSEAEEIVKTSEDENKEMEIFLKKFVKLERKKAGGLRKELEALDLLELKNMHIAKIIDIVPEDASDVNKIFTDVSLNQDGVAKILEIVKKYR